MTSGDGNPLPVALILAGGVGLGAFQVGLFAALDKGALLRVDAVAGSSIGAFNGAIIAGNPPEKRLEMLERFWRRMEAEPVPAWPDPLQVLRNRALESFSGITSTVMTRLGGVPGLLRPAAMGASGIGDGPGLYDPSPAIATLEDHVDFDLLNDGPVRLCICATDVETGEPVLFDTGAGDRISPLHIIASGALPPNVPPVRIEGRLLADGGLCANAPMEPLLSSERSGDIPRWVILADLFSVQGAPPQSLASAAERANDLKYGCQTTVRLAGLERERRLEAATEQRRSRAGTDLVMLDLREPQEPSRMEKIFDFSRASLLRRQEAGWKAGELALEVVASAGRESPAGLRIHMPQDTRSGHTEAAG
ncbi:MAG: patatin-like phospholipase family protein [Sphingobium sp.]